MGGGQSKANNKEVPKQQLTNSTIKSQPSYSSRPSTTLASQSLTPSSHKSIKHQAESSFTPSFVSSQPQPILPRSRTTSQYVTQKPTKIQKDETALQKEELTTVKPEATLSKQPAIVHIQTNTLAKSMIKQDISKRPINRIDRQYETAIVSTLPKSTIKQDISKRSINRVDRQYEYTKQDAIKLSKMGFQEEDSLLTVKQCRNEMEKQLQKLNRQYKYTFEFKQKERKIDRSDHGKKMTRIIYLVFECRDCNNRWTSIAGTFQVTFSYDRKYKKLLYHIQIFKEECRKCKIQCNPLIYTTQMEAMNIFFTVLLINILNEVPPPQKPKKYYIRENHWHKSQLCEACKLGRCATQRE